ncbi:MULTISPECIES: ubiquinol-cytochrome c reductase iron-sulfur subunit [Gordonia]|uniref:Cytochrome bc1 complex Rieske iron-sulfur subunit n=1 Tax=Gordonia cholesterolivorans TaxID=559625 RepID=A0ABN3HPM5_9ACTN|nr:Rieske (2Fe-2S) protein [Gordonia sp. QH-12]KXT56304.1 (2Fe-2S)-binding protein [Gordonia sp. QH-12]
MSSDTPTSTSPAGVSRRTFVAGAGATAGALTLGVALSACGSRESAPAGVTPPSGAPAGTLATVSDVPVGGGVIAGDVVITQPRAGDYQAFTATCTHAGCTLSGVSDGTIDCPCHGSKFHLDGTVANGPADRPLSKVSVRVDGSNIIRE